MKVPSVSKENSKVVGLGPSLWAWVVEMAINWNVLSLVAETDDQRRETQLSQALQRGLVGLGGTQEIEAEGSGVGKQLRPHETLWSGGGDRDLIKLLRSKGPCPSLVTCQRGEHQLSKLPCDLHKHSVAHMWTDRQTD